MFSFSLVVFLNPIRLDYMDEEEDLQETAPEKIPVSVNGFQDTTDAQDFAYYIAYTVRAISRYIDLSRLDGITVAFDYDKALAALDRGYEAMHPLTPTTDDRVLGVGMAPAVIRDGVIKCHLVFNAPMVLPIQDEAQEGFKNALYLIAHECAHVEELLHRDERFPGTILQPVITDYEEAVLSSITDALWSEYAACRLSAIFGDEEASAYEECFVGALDVARTQANERIRDYRVHGEINRLLEEAGRPLCEPLRFAAYLSGHLDGRDEDWSAVPTARECVAKSEYAPFIERMVEALRELWNTADSWESLTVFDPLKDIARDALEMGGIILIHQDDGTLYVDVPYSEETMPI